MPPLTDRAIKSARPEAKPRKLFDGEGLYLLLNPSGTRLWRMKYRVDGREKFLSFGQYPEVPLKVARERRDEARLTGGRSEPALPRRRAERPRTSTSCGSSLYLTGFRTGCLSRHGVRRTGFGYDRGRCRSACLCSCAKTNNIDASPTGSSH